MSVEVEKARDPIFVDIRRYYCEYCGICRSKKTLIAAHIRAHHEYELKEKELNEDKVHDNKLNICEECGASFQKPAHLKQHMQSHSIEIDDTLLGVSIGSQKKELQNAMRLQYKTLNGLVPGGRPPEKIHQGASITLAIRRVDDCQSSYRRKDHLTRHMLQHKGKLFECPVDGCKQTFAYQGNMTRHVKEFHDESSSSANVDHPKEYVCSEHGCGKVFKYPSKLHKHEDSHVMLDSVEALCAEPGCMKYFSNEKCLREHIRLCHQYIICDKCGTKQLKKNIKRHMRTHEEAELCLERIKCNFEGCSLTFSTTSNLNQHIKAVHKELKPFACGMPGCNKRFAFKHVRDNHEKSGCHIFTPGNFEESDEQFRSRPRGGRKRNYSVIESLMRKRVVSLGESEPAMNEGEEGHRSWPNSLQNQEIADSRNSKS